MNRQKIFITSGLLILLLGLGGADALLTESRSFTVYEPSDTTIGESPDVAKPVGPDVIMTADAMLYAPKLTTERSLLASIVPPGVVVHSRILLLDDDRLTFMAWTESPDAKAYFIALKEALLRSFSPQVSGLVDHVQVRDGKANRSILTFIDPAIHEERLIFVRSRERLYEFHIAAGREAEVQKLIDALTDS